MNTEAMLLIIDALDARKITAEQARAYVKAGLSADQVRQVISAEKPYYGPG